MKTFLLMGRYFPFPQPMSRPMEPGGSEVRKRSIRGHGYICVSDGNAKMGAMEEETHTLYRVEEKCGAISSYTE
jgi:hypothetical protein